MERVNADESSIVKSNFNDWIVRKRLAIVHEIYAGHNWKAYDKLKSTITDKKLRVHQKYLPPFDLEISVHILACSNSLKALKIDEDDRRWLVPRVTNLVKPQTYWDDFRRWLEADKLGNH